MRPPSNADEVERDPERRPCLSYVTRQRFDHSTTRPVTPRQQRSDATGSSFPGAKKGGRVDEDKPRGAKGQQQLALHQNLPAACVLRLHFTSCAARTPGRLLRYTPGTTNLAQASRVTPSELPPFIRRQLQLPACAPQPPALRSLDSLACGRRLHATIAGTPLPAPHSTA